MKQSLNWPNRLTISRLIIVIIMVVLALFPIVPSVVIIDWGPQSLTLNRLVIFGLFTLGVLTDFLDGYIARKYHLITPFGKLLDPIADKLLINSLLIILTAQGEIPALITILMIGRDVMVDALRMVVIEQGKVIAASVWGKSKTALQMVALIFILLNNFPFFYLNLAMNQWLLYLATAVSLYSGVDYFWKNRQGFEGAR